MSADGTRTSIYYVAVKAITWLFGIDAVSISVDNLQHIQPHFVPSSIFSFTENSAKRLCELSHQSAVAVILTDLPADELESMTCNWHSSWMFRDSRYRGVWPMGDCGPTATLPVQHVKIELSPASTIRER